MSPIVRVNNLFWLIRQMAPQSMRLSLNYFSHLLIHSLRVTCTVKRPQTTQNTDQQYQQNSCIWFRYWLQTDAFSVADCWVLLIDKTCQESRQVQHIPASTLYTTTEYVAQPIYCINRTANAIFVLKKISISIFFYLMKHDFRFYSPFFSQKYHWSGIMMMMISYDEEAGLPTHHIHICWLTDSLIINCATDVRPNGLTR